VNLLGAITAQVIYFLCILVFTSRLAERPEIGHGLGIVLLLTGIPLLCLLLSAPRLDRPPLYYVQIILMLVWLVLELLLDYILKVEFRQVRWIVYVTVFFGALGGMIGVAANAGKPWAVSSVVLFLVTALLAFVQRAKAGM
jgi:hypothetical protein